MSDNSTSGQDSRQEDDNSLPESSVFIRLINRYISVWVWSILFGLATSLSFTITNVRNIGRFGELSFAIGALYVLGAIFLFRAWFILLQYLRQFLVPMIFSRSGGGPSHNPTVLLKLSHALAALVAALAFLVMASFLGAALEFTVGRF